MTKEELIAKYELENNCIFKRRPDLDAHGDFSLEGIKVFCNSQFIEQLKALTPTAVVQAKPEVCECGETPLKEPHLFIEGKYRCKCGRAIAN